MATGNIFVSPATNTSYCVTQNITITGNVTFQQSEFKISPNVVISVAPGATLTLDHAHLHTCGTDMWDGISVQSGGKLKVINNSLVEDAKCAISIINSANSFANILTVDNSMFNKNHRSINIKNYTFSTATTYPFSITNSLFTCRSIANYATFMVYSPTATVKGTNGASSPLQASYINNSQYPLASLKAPFAGQKPYAGIHAELVGSTTGAGSSATYYEMVIGGGNTSQYNLFDNLVMGVYAIHSNISLYNNVFQNGIVAGLGNPNLPGLSGSGVYGTSQSTRKNRLNIASSGSTTNLFYDLYKAVSAIDFYALNVIGAYIHSTQAEALFMASFRRGCYGIIAQSSQYDAVNLDNNFIYNIENGITYKATLTMNLSQMTGSVSISNNVLSPVTSTMTLSNQFSSNAITLNNVASGTPNTNNNAVMRVSNNKVRNHYRGILCQNWRNQPLIVEFNDITLRPLTYNTASLQYGIETDNTYTPYMNVFYSPHRVNYNTVDHPSGQSTNANLYGISSGHCSGIAIGCNILINTYHGTAFNGVEPEMFSRADDYTNTKYGFVLENGGVIGTQGIISGPVDHEWIGTTWTPPSYKTVTFNSLAYLSKLYVRQTPAQYNPNGSGTTVGGSSYFNAPFFGSLLYSYSRLAYQECVLSKPLGDDSLTVLESIVLGGETPFPGCTESNEAGQYQVYRILRDNPDLGNLREGLSTFYATASSGEMETMVRIEEAMAEGNRGDVNTLLNDMKGESRTGAAFKSYYQLLYHYQDSAFDANDSLELLRLANLCPSLDGIVVYHARALYNLIAEQNVSFTDHCDCSHPEEFLSSHDIQNDLARVEVYPNPTATGEFFVSLPQQEGTLLIQVMDVQGKAVYTKNCDTRTGTPLITIPATNGVYLVHITLLESGQHTVKKLIIQNR